MRTAPGPDGDPSLFVRPRGQHSLGIKLVVSFLLPAVFSVVLVTALLFSLFAQKAREDLDRINALYLQGVRTQMDTVLSQAKRLCYVIGTDQIILDSLDSLPTDVLRYSRVTTQINQLMVSSAYVDSIFLCLHNKVAFTAYQRDSYRESKDKVLAMVRGARQLEPAVRYVIRTNGELGRVLSLVYNVSNSAGYVDSAVAVNLNLEALLGDLLGGAFPAGPTGQSYYFLDRSGQVLADSHWLLESGTSLGRGDLARLAETTALSGSLEVGTESGPRLVAFARSADSGSLAATVVDHHVYLAGIEGIRNLAFGVSGLVLSVILAWTLLAWTRLYGPLQGMVQRIGRLAPERGGSGRGNEIDRASRILSQTAERLNAAADPSGLDPLGHETLSILLLGQGSVEDRVARAALVRAGLGEEGVAAWRVLFLRLDPPMTPSGFDLEELAAVCRECLGVYRAWAVCPMPPDGLVLVVPVETPADGASAQLRRDFAELGAQLARPQSGSVSFGIGDAVPGLAALRDSFRQARQRADYRPLLGRACIADSDGPVAGQVDQAALARCREHIGQATAAQDRGRFGQLLAEHAALVAGASFPERMEALLDLAATICQVGSRVAPPEGGHGGRDVLVGQLAQLCGPEEVDGWLRSLFDHAGQVLSGIHSQHSAALVGQACALLDRHYADPMLSAALVAERLAITPQYFSRIFNETTGSSFPDYLKNLRLEKARSHMLEHADASLAEICQGVGFGNPSYFSTAFKQKFGVTPGRFRQSCLRSDRA